MDKQLDFICIGAPKSATSTLFELLEQHPEIFIPSAKEVPYFNDDKEYAKGWKWYIKTFFSDAREDQVIGTITPQYMAGMKSVSPEVIANRIHKQNDSTKIIAILRDPISRSFSHFKMYERFGHFKSNFEHTFHELLSDNLTRHRKDLKPENTWLFASEYGRILSAYQKTFSKSNVLVLFTDNFKNNPAKTLEEVFSFLEVDVSFMPKDIHRKSHVGGSKAKIKYLTPAYMSKMPLINYLWKRVVPANVRKKIFIKITRWNIKPDNKELNKDSEVYKHLVDFFKDDIKLLEKLLEKKVPWQDWQSQSSS